MRSGYTLLEVVFVAALLGLSLVASLPAARRQVDRAAVLGAREALVGLFARARVEARAGGGARVRFLPLEGRAWVEAAGVAVGALDLPSEFGVRLSVPGEPDEVVLVYDALGIGRRASRTIRLLRGEASATLVVAAYGRVERR